MLKEKTLCLSVWTKPEWPKLLGFLLIIYFVLYMRVVVRVFCPAINKVFFQQHSQCAPFSQDWAMEGFVHRIFCRVVSKYIYHLYFSDPVQLFLWTQWLQFVSRCPWRLQVCLVWRGWQAKQVCVWEAVSCSSHQHVSLSRNYSRKIAFFFLLTSALFFITKHLSKLLLKPDASWGCGTWMWEVGESRCTARSELCSTWWTSSQSKKQ